MIICIYSVKKPQVSRQGLPIFYAMLPSTSTILQGDGTSLDAADNGILILRPI